MKRDTQIVIKLTQEEKKQWQNFADEYSVNLSHLVRKLMAQHMENMKKSVAKER